MSPLDRQGVTASVPESVRVGVLDTGAVVVIGYRDHQGVTEPVPPGPGGLNDRGHLIRRQVLVAVAAVVRIGLAPDSMHFSCRACLNQPQFRTHSQPLSTRTVCILGKMQREFATRFQRLASLPAIRSTSRISNVNAGSAMRSPVEPLGTQLGAWPRPHGSTSGLLGGRLDVANFATSRGRRGVPVTVAIRNVTVIFAVDAVLGTAATTERQPEAYPSNSPALGAGEAWSEALPPRFLVTERSPDG